MDTCAITPYLVGRLQQSAIDAWMHDQGWRLYDGHYEISSRGGSSRVTRPGPDGQGGGDWSSDLLGSLFGLVDRDDEFQTAFGQIRQDIETLVAPWLDLPDPSSVSPIVEECRQVTRRLSGAASAQGGIAAGAGELGGYIKLIEQNSAAMSGELIASFKAKFLVQLGQVVGGFHAISVVRGADVAAQEGLWTAARSSVDRILVQGREAFDAVAAGGSITWEQVVDVVGWAAKGLKIFATGGLATAFEVGGLGVEVVKATAPATTTTDKATPGSFDEAMTQLRTAFSTLNTQIRDEERQLDDNLQTNLRNIRNDPTSYDLTQPPIHDGDGILLIQRALVEEIYRVHMPAVADELDRIGNLALQSRTSWAVTRDASIGIGATGPSSSVSEMNLLLYELVKELAWEVRNGARNLELAIADLDRQDAKVAEELAKIVERIEKGSSYTPWG